MRLLLPLSRLALVWILLVFVSCKKDQTTNTQNTQPSFSNGPGVPDLVYSIVGYNNNLIVGEFAAGISQWNGSVWTYIDSAINGSVYALTVYNGNLIATGQFSQAGNKSVNNVAQLSGSSWQALGTGINNKSVVSALTIYNGNLIAGGSFDSAGSTPANRIAQWNGSSWQSIGKGINNSNGIVSTLIVYNGNLIAAGSFDSAGGIGANNIAQWNGVTWTTLGLLSTGLNGPAYTMETYNGNLVVGGSFTTAGGNSVTNIAQWNGVAWQTIGVGPNLPCNAP